MNIFWNEGEKTEKSEAMNTGRYKRSVRKALKGQILNCYDCNWGWVVEKGWKLMKMEVLEEHNKIFIIISPYREVNRIRTNSYLGMAI